MKFKTLILISIIALALVFRFYKLGEIPKGIHADEESHGYNAFSLLKTGKDRYGQRFPILFRSFGSYQPPVYTYLTIVPVAIFGNTIFSARFVSALAGVILILVTYLVCIKLFRIKFREEIGLISALVIAISPWSIYYSRLTAEGNLGVTVFAISILLFILSLKNAKFFVLACFVLGLSTHAYYSERLVSILFIPAFLLLYKNYFYKNKKWVVWGLILFVITMIPHILILTSGALTKRLDQVGNHSGGFFPTEFVRKYLTYFSPSNLFFDTGSQLRRMSPEIGVYFSIFIAPFLIGIAKLSNLIEENYKKLIILLVIILPIPAALTGDNFYPLRTLDLIWIFGIIIGVGIFYIIRIVLPKTLGIALLGVVLIFCLFSFYISYFILFKYERAADYGYYYIPLVSDLEQYKDRQILIDSARDPGIGLRIAYLASYDPAKLQEQLKSQLKTAYYSSDVNGWENYDIGNIHVHPLNWGDSNCKNKILVGDPFSISSEQVEQHRLTPLVTIKDFNGSVALNAYSTDPKGETCK